MSNTTAANVISSGALIVAYYAFSLIIVGTLCNLLTFVILCREKFRDTHERPSLHYMRVIAIIDIFMLYGWNLDHYLSNIYGFAMQTFSIGSCKFFSFLNYFAPQTSAWLRVFICLDRYLSLSRLHRTWFGRSKNILIIIGSVMSIFFLFNLHIMIFGCFYNTDDSINPDARLYQIYPLWDQINLALYNIIPFVLMVTLNSGVIYHLIRLRRTSTVQNSRIQHRGISITLVVTTFLFCIMTTPSTIAYGFFYSDSISVVLNLLDCILYSYHAMSFPLYLITFAEFRREFVKMILCKKNNPRVGSMTLTTARTAGQT